MANKTQLGIGAVIAVLFAAYFGIDLNQQKNESVQQPKVEYSDQQSNHTTQNSNSSDTNKVQNDQYANSQSQHGLEVIRQSYERKLSNVQVQSVGRVKAILRDDNDGSRHQKFILTLDNGLTVLVAHNIDLAPRINNLHLCTRQK